LGDQQPVDALFLSGLRTAFAVDEHRESDHGRTPAGHAAAVFDLSGVCDDAQDFIALNPSHTDPANTRRLPWYSSKYWGAMVLGLIAASGLVLLIFGRTIGKYLG